MNTAMNQVSGSPHNLAFLEELYEQYLKDPQSVPPDFKQYFSSMNSNGAAGGGYRTQPRFSNRSIFSAVETNGHVQSLHVSADQALKQERVSQLVRNFRVRGHNMARLDPLDRPRPEIAELTPENMGLTAEDMDRQFSTALLGGPQQVQTLREILARMWNTYCRYIGVQFMHIDDMSVRAWLQERMESTENRLEIPREEQLHILKRLTDAVVFEQFLQKKYIGAKTFSLEGAETLIPLLVNAFEKAGTQGVAEAVIAMAHRGRLNVLANILGKSPQAIFREFDDKEPQRYIGGGDVKYHLGYSSDWRTTHGQKIHLSLCFNPSHLEFINPVAMGRLRAKQDRVGDHERRRGLVIMIHGDSALAGEGVVQETLNMSQLPGYRVGGALHIVLNNQVGFTTLPEQYRSSMYCTDVARMLQAPVFHVNGEDPEAVAQVIQVAMDFRQEFQRDVFVDMYCFRRRGHNEGDEPQFTQPLMYQMIEKHKGVREAYVDRLLRLGGLTLTDADEMERQRTEKLEKALNDARGGQKIETQKDLQGIWQEYVGGPEAAVKDVETGISKETLASVLEAISRVPDDFHPHAKVTRILESRREMAGGAKPLDWAAAELAAFGSLALQGHRVRLTGQDSERGTFSHRHAVLHDIEDGHTHHVLHHIASKQAPVEIINSCLNETGVLGFEYGYSLDCPEGLIAWEAQFGDFANAAQVIIDQFITSAEDKWHRLSGIVMLLPHGFEGQGPEHSSARLERFLTLAAEDNIQIAVPTTPAQYFHLLRRQVVRKWRKPLVVMTPKSLLRNPECVSPIEAFTTGTYQRVILDDAVKANKVGRILLCAGKVYYDLVKRRADTKRNDIAIVRLEQLYPFPDTALEAALKHYGVQTPVYWVQEEPRNMGAWPFLRSRLGYMLYERYPFYGVARSESASPATGSPNAHKIEQEMIIAEAFGE